MPAGTNPAFLYGILGGTLDPLAAQRAVFGASGELLFEAVDGIARP
jgi:hypothetical protein